jgi:hypothetical protein
MSFHIGSQHGTINNVQGDQTIHGGQHSTFHGAAEDPAALVTRLQQALDRAVFPPELAARLRDELGALNSAVAAPTPDRPQAADRLARITRIVASAGALTAAAGPIAGALAALAHWLGPLGESVLRTIGR